MYRPKILKKRKEEKTIFKHKINTITSPACIASVSARVRRESWDESKKKGMRGEREGSKGHLPTNPTILKNCVRPRMQFLIGAVLAVLIK